jgi:transcriptional antiterminator RfaH
MSMNMTVPDATGGARWFALYTKPHREYAVRDHLSDRGIDVFLPEMPNKTQRRDRPARRPLFPHYLFARLDLSDGIMAHVPWTPGLRTIVSFEGRPTPVAGAMIDHVRRRAAEMLAAGPEEQFLPGDRVRVAHGPFEGLDAVFDRRLSPGGRVRILLDCMHRFLGADIDLDDLEPPR